MDTRLQMLQRKPVRMCCTLPASVAGWLAEEALVQGRSISNLLAALVEHAMRVDQTIKANAAAREVL